jgi:hypothetical protein
MGVYKRGDVWYIDFYVGGKRMKEAVGPKKKEAEAALGKILGLIREGRYFDAKKIKPITFDDMATKFSNGCVEPQPPITYNSPASDVSRGSQPGSRNVKSKPIGLCGDGPTWPKPGPINGESRARHPEAALRKAVLWDTSKGKNPRT